MNEKRATNTACGSQDACGCGVGLADRATDNPLVGFSRTLLWAFGLIIAMVVLLIVAAESWPPSNSASWTC